MPLLQWTLTDGIVIHLHFNLERLILYIINKNFKELYTKLAWGGVD